MTLAIFRVVLVNFPGAFDAWDFSGGALGILSFFRMVYMCTCKC